MNLRDKAIFDWANKNVPHIRPHVARGLEIEAVQAMMAVAFEAGRQFQADNPKLELDNPNVYLIPDGK